jgi:hypothetical protein
MGAVAVDEPDTLRRGEGDLSERILDGIDDRPAPVRPRLPRRTLRKKRLGLRAILIELEEIERDRLRRIAARESPLKEEMRARGIDHGSVIAHLGVFGVRHEELGLGKWGAHGGCTSWFGRPTRRRRPAVLFLMDSIT